MRALLVGETPLSLVGVVDVIHAFGRHSAVAAVPSAAMARARVLDEPSWIWFSWTLACRMPSRSS